MQEQEIYQKIGELLWSIMVDDADTIYCEGFMYPEIDSYSFEWITKQNKIAWFEMNEIPHEAGQNVISLMEELRSLDFFFFYWTHFKISLTEQGNIDFKFAYIPKNDYWPGLFMRGVSELNKDELDEYNIPFEEWETCIKLREQDKE